MKESWPSLITVRYRGDMNSIPCLLLCHLTLNFVTNPLTMADIIPLAKKLKDCGVFGVSSDEYLSYALKNRHEWEQKGKQAVTEMLSNLD
jgi:hypothetical protein